MPAASVARTENVCHPACRSEYVAGESQGAYADPSALQVNVAGSLALNENTAPSRSGNSWDKPVSGGVSSSEVVAGVALLEDADDSVLGEPGAFSSTEGERAEGGETDLSVFDG